MSYDSLLIDTCTVVRFTEAEANAYGILSKTYGNHLVGEPCRLSSPVNREVKVGAEVVIADAELFLHDVDITEQDRVIISGVTYEILSVMSRRHDISGLHHKECLLRTVR